MPLFITILQALIDGEMSELVSFPLLHVSSVFFVVVVSLVYEKKVIVNFKQTRFISLSSL